MISEDAYVSDEEELECPLCMEEFDISDRTFKPCTCGYQICRFWYNRIVNSETANGCPACRRQYTEETVEFKPLSAEEWKKDQQRIHSRKLKEKEKRDSEMASRRHLSNMRVVQKNLVYVIGFSPKSADADLAATLRGNDYFAQYGKINKIVVNKKSHPNGQPTVGVYITYAKKEDAARAVQAVDNTMNDGRVLRASFGTTKYCSAYLRQQVCQNPNCMYLHEPGEDLDSYTREDMSTIQHAAKAAEGMHANALAAHHMRRAPSRADSSNTSIQDDSNTAALPPTASWASMPKPSETTAAQEAGGPNTTAQGHIKPDTLPPPSTDTSAPRGEIPPPPSQAAQDSVNPSDLLPSPVQVGLNHPYLGGTLKFLYEGRFNFNFVPQVMPGLSEADVKSAENFPQLFSWDPQIRRPSSPSKNGKNHGRSGSRYAFAAESKTPPPGFIPPGLATGLQPPGFTAGGQATGKEGATDFFSQFLRNANSSDVAPSAQVPYEDPAIVGLRETRGETTKSKSNVLDNPQIDSVGTPRSRPPTLGPGPGTSMDLSRFSPFDRPVESPDMLSASRSPEIEKPQSKFGASFAKLENLENQAQEMTMKTDQRARSTWEPTSRPRDIVTRAPPHLPHPNIKVNDVSHNPLMIPKSSGTWQPSPPPPKILSSPSPKPATNSMAQRFGPAFKPANKVPWEPSPPPSTSRTNSPLKPNQNNAVVQSISSQSPAHDTRASRPQLQTTQSQQSILAQDEFPALVPVSQQPEVVAPVAHTPTKKMWDTIAPVTATPISPSGTPRGSMSPMRRNSGHSVVSSAADRGRSRQGSTSELPSNVHTPRELSPAMTTPIPSRATSPIMTPTFSRTTSALGAVPNVSSPLASLNTGKQIRIVSSKAAEEAKLKAEKLAAEERAIKKIKADEAAAAAKSMIRKSVPLASVKKTKEQRQAEQKERAERRELESVASSQPEDQQQPTPTEIAPIIGRARKQKNKAAGTKTPTKASAAAVVVKTSAAAAATDGQAEDTPRGGGGGSDSVETTTTTAAAAAAEVEEDLVTDAKTAASDAILALSQEINLYDFKFFQPIPNAITHAYQFSAEELKQGAELASWPAYTGKETVEQLEKLLASAKKEAHDTFKVLEKCQKRNIKFARVVVTSVCT